MAPRYTRAELIHIFNNSPVKTVSSQVFSDLKLNGICATRSTHRGTTAGTRHQRPITTRVTNRDSPYGQQLSGKVNINNQLSCDTSKQSTVRGVNHSNLVPLRKITQTAATRIPSTDSFKVGLINARSVSNKSGLLRELAIDNDLSCLEITKTWLKDGDGSTISDLCPPSYAFH